MSPSPFAAALAAMDADLDTHMGETISIVPVRVSDYGTAPDPERSTFDVVALVNYVDPSAADSGKMESRVAYEETEVGIRRALLPTGSKVRKNDEVLLLDRPGTPRLKVSRIDDVDPERLCLTLARLSTSEG
jgi:hypothetical protein